MKCPSVLTKESLKDSVLKNSSFRSSAATAVSYWEPEVAVTACVLLRNGPSFKSCHELSTENGP